MKTQGEQSAKQKAQALHKKAPQNEKSKERKNSIKYFHLIEREESIDIESVDEKDELF